MKYEVKPDAVLSAVLFTVYIDSLFQKIRKFGVGSHIDRVFAGAFGYTDDIVILSSPIY